MSHGKKAAAQIALLLAGAAMLCFGVWRGEAATVLSKAIKLCLECVGIGDALIQSSLEEVRQMQVGQQRRPRLNPAPEAGHGL